MNKPRTENFIKLAKKIDQLQTENLRYRQALMFYADESKYEGEHGRFWNIILDGGKTAREALGVDKFETRQNRDDKTMGK